ncbi:hypothetical protein [Sphaerisporangium sp. B11E5]|uniref:hypothetical protein n=1 Tax=Sphaerisporangium sp. B11E5 TaxID=3153563 RepID=UPI00325FC987
MDELTWARSWERLDGPSRPGLPHAFGELPALSMDLSAEQSGAVSSAQPAGEVTSLSAPIPEDDTAPPRLTAYANELIDHLAAHQTPPAPARSVLYPPAHWLAPAIEALLLILKGEDATAPLHHATELDDEHTALFLCLTLAISGNGDRVHASWLGTAFGDLTTDTPVTQGQRALWTAAARGAYGPAGKIFVLRKLDAAAVPSTTEPDRWLNALTPGEPATAASPALTTLPQLADLPEIARPIQAAARLSTLLARCTEITTPSEVPQTPGDDLVAALRTLIGAQETPPPRPLTDHLLDDVSDGADPRLTAIAFHVAAPVVRAAAEELAEESRVPPPDELTVPVNGHPILLRPEGPDANSLAAAEHAITAAGEARLSGRWLAYGPAVLPIVALVLAFTVSELFAVASLVLGGIAGVILWRRSQKEQAETRRVQQEIGELRLLADTAVWALHDHAREALQRADQATADLATLTRLLRRGPAIADPRP